MLRVLGTFFDRICVVIGALLFMQGPLFIQHYIQQLTGREAELRREVELMRHASQLTGKTLNQFVQKFLSSQDNDFRHQGELMQNIIVRWQQFSEALFSLNNSSVWDRPFLFIAHFNLDVAKSTFQQYSFGIPLTLEGGIYAFIGITLGYLFCSGLRACYRNIRLLTLT